MKRASLFSKFIIVLIPLLVVAAVATGAGLGYFSHRSFLKTIRADYRVAAAEACHQIDHYIQTAFEEIEATAALVAAIRLDPWRTHMAFQEVQYHFKRFQHMCLLDLEGRTMGAECINTDLLEPEAKAVFQQARQGRPAFSRLILLDRIPVMFIAAPVHRDGRQTAVVWARLNVKLVWDLVIQLKRDLNFGPNGHVYLVDRDHRLIASDEISRQFGQVFDLAVPRTRGRTSDVRKPGSGNQDQRPFFWIAGAGGARNIYLRSGLERPQWTLYMVQPYHEAFQFLYQGLLASLGVLAVVTLLGILLAWYTTRRFLGPVARLHQGVARAAQGDLGRPIEVDSRDEVGDLAEHFNEMQKSLQEYIHRLVEATTDLNHAKNLAVLGTTASQVNHQVGNFLNNLVLALSILKADKLSESSKTSLGIIEENTQQIQLFIQRLMDLARKTRVDLSPWKPHQEIDRIVRSFRPQADAAGVELMAEIEETPPVLADAALLDQAIGNLIQNALEACDPGDRIRVRVRLAGGRVAVEVTDTGRGIPREHLEHVFTPFFTTKIAKGTGLGLALVQSVFQTHGGETSITSSPDQGTQVTCWLPTAPAGSKTDPAPGGAPAEPAESDTLPGNY